MKGHNFIKKYALKNCKNEHQAIGDLDLCMNGMKEHRHNHNHRHFAKITKIQ